ncbi:VOC family protein [Halothece sp. PCC 7418]|uniref:VOC family protein n=1 Tax=Halothece sp. (strain PCC 7418) TaxID=65093 RepID=UPI0002E9EF10|nr:VOC family protein [Halothece sp. PCC 7418]
MTVTRYLHTAILVSDLEKAELFYSDLLKLPKAERSLKFPGVWYQIGDYQIHLIEDKNWKPLEPNPEKWGRCPHLALAVDDLDSIKTDLTAKGYPFQESSSGRAALFTKDPDGNIIELSQA